MRRVWPAIAVVTLLALTTAGCTTNASNYPTPTETSSSATPRIPHPTNLPTVPPGYVDTETGETITPAPVANWSDDDRLAAVDAATKAMTAFARPSLDRETWWAELSPLLTSQARADYAYLQPQVIPASSVIAIGTLTDDESAYVAHVDVPTDAGTYTVVLTRQDGASSWLVARFTPPESTR